MPLAAASTSRWFRPLRNGWKLCTSSTAPATVIGRSRLAYGNPSTVAEPSSGSTSPRSIRSVVLLPAPFGPTNPVTRPGTTSKLSPSTAVIDPNRLVSRLATIAGEPTSAGAALFVAACIPSPFHPVVPVTTDARDEGAARRPPEERFPASSQRRSARLQAEPGRTRPDS